MSASDADSLLSAVCNDPDDGSLYAVPHGKLLSEFKTSFAVEVRGLQRQCTLSYATSSKVRRDLGCRVISPFCLTSVVSTCKKFFPKG